MCEWEWPAPRVVKYDSTATTANAETIATSPARGLYRLLKNLGRHGSVSEVKAVGSRWTKAVAMRTPVPKCWHKKMMVFCLELPLDSRRERRGKPHAVKHLLDQDRHTGRTERIVNHLPSVLRMRIRNRAKT